VVELDRRVGEPVDVFVNDRFIARGELVLIDGSLGVTLTEIVKQDG
jgi:flagellar motor switch protein FliN/FliY